MGHDVIISGQCEMSFMEMINTGYLKYSDALPETIVA